MIGRFWKKIYMFTKYNCPWTKIVCKNIILLLSVYFCKYIIYRYLDISQLKYTKYKLQVLYFHLLVLVITNYFHIWLYSNKNYVNKKRTLTKTKNNLAKNKWKSKSNIFIYVGYLCQPLTAKYKNFYYYLLLLSFFIKLYWKIV